jgi:hypothetical protein
VPELEPALVVLTFAGWLLGSWGILWARTSRVQGRASWGRTLFLGALVCLGASSLVAAVHRADGLAPLGLSAGLLVVGMLWESPRRVGRETESLTLAD